MSKLRQAFNARFRKWNITLSETDVTERKEGSIQQNGWTINYHFGAESEREYIEFFTSHRMTNDRLYRIYEDGSAELVDACLEFYKPDDPNGKRELQEHNRKFYNRVRELGLA